MNQPAPRTAAQPYPHYEIIESLGEGAVATVYRVRSARDGAILALKSLKPDHAETERAIRRFEDEFRILHRLHHPALPEVYDYGRAVDGTRYIVMELIEGTTLDGHFADHPGDFWLLAYELTEALSFIHEHELLHLDLKPGNVLVKRTRAYSDDEIPLAMLLDFGVTYQRDEGGKVKMIGTPEYMAPEIIRGDENPTRAADYYSLGAMLYEMVEGHVPFEGSMDDVLRAHLTRTVSFGKTKVEFAALYPLIERLLSKTPNDRYDAFGDFRRLVNERVSGSVEGLERAYALGFIESLGLFGKQRVWDEVVSWASALPARRQPVNVRAKDPPDVTTLEGGETASDFADRVRKDLLSVASGTPTTVDPAGQQRYLNLTGPPESGKAFLLRALRAESLPRGHDVIELDAPGQFDALSTTTERSGSAPRGRQPDRLAPAWSALENAAAVAGALVTVKNAAALSPEIREFLEYAIKRADLAVSEGEEPGIFFAVASESPNLKKELCALIADERACVSVELPAPAAPDVEAIVSEFHGHMSGADERRSLAEYLSQHLASDGVLMTALRHAVAEGALLYRGGTWEFHGVKAPLEVKTGSADYYRELLSGLPKAGRELALWLSCHPGTLSAEQLSKISGISQASIRRGIAQLTPYRMLIVTRREQGSDVRFTSDGMREAVYSTIAPGDRANRHESFLNQDDPRSPHRTEDLLCRLFHYQESGKARSALIERLIALRETELQRDLHLVRKLGVDGINYARSQGYDLCGRYFLKRVLENEFSTHNYQGVINLIDEHYPSERAKVPASFLYQYAYSLQSTGDVQAFEKLRADFQNIPASETHNHVLVAEVSFLQARRRYDEGLEVLRKINPKMLRRSVLNQFYVMSALIHLGLKNEQERKKFTRLAVQSATANGDVEHLLRINYHDALLEVGKGHLADAKAIVRESVRLAARHQQYRSLCTMYFLAGSVYATEGDYERVTRYIKKAIRLGTDLGMDDHVTAYKVRLGIAYKHMGRYGLAIRQLEETIRRLREEDHEYLYGLLILLEVHSLLYSPGATQTAEKARDIATARRVDYRSGMYHWFIGDLFRRRADYRTAIGEYERAVEVLRSFGQEDDATCSLIGLAQSYLGVSNLKKAETIAAEAERAVHDIDSPDVSARYACLNIEMTLARRTGDSEALVDAAHRGERDLNLPASFPTIMDLEASLCLAYHCLGDSANMAKHFKGYYQGLKFACSDLPPDLIDAYSKNPVFLDLVLKRKEANKKSPS